MKRNSSTTNAKATKPAAKGYITELQLLEAHQRRLEAIDANQAHRAKLAKYGLGQYDPSELFASI